MKVSPKCTVWYDNQGKRYRSSIEVQRALALSVDDTCTESETGEETASEYEPSPVKRQKTDMYVSLRVLVACRPISIIVVIASSGSWSKCTQNPSCLLIIHLVPHRLS